AALNGVRPAAGDAITSFDGISRATDVVAAVERMRTGQVAIAFVRGTNPAYALPKSARFSDAFSKVPFKVSFSMFPDETTELCDLVLPDLHSLESWGDAESMRGTITLQQPAMDPVFSGTRSTADVLIAVAKKDAAAAVNDFYLSTYPSATLGDGRGANKPWLQELPDPVTKVLWSSWAEIHPETAARLGIERGDIVEVKTSAGSIRVPALVYLGVRPDTIAVPLGQGHASPTQGTWFDGRDKTVQWGYGRYARAVGANALDLLPARANAGGGFIGATRCSITKTGDHSTVVSTEGSA